MPRQRDASSSPTPIEQVFDTGETSLLDVLDHVLSKGVLASGDLTLGVAGVDLIYVRLSALLCAADRVLPTPARKRAGTAGAPRRSGTPSNASRGRQAKSRARR